MRTKARTVELDIEGLPKDNLKELKDLLTRVKNIQYFKPDGNPKKEWKVFFIPYNLDFARWEAELAASKIAKDWMYRDSRGLAHSAAKQAVLKDPVRNNAQHEAEYAVSYAAKYRLEKFGHHASGGLAFGSDVAITWDAINDATLMARLISVKDLDFKDKEKHINHAKARMEVWEKGYGLLCELNGVFYVYTDQPKFELQKLRS